MVFKVQCPNLMIKTSIQDKSISLFYYTDIENVVSNINDLFLHCRDSTRLIKYLNAKYKVKAKLYKKIPFN